MTETSDVQPEQNPAADQIDIEKGLHRSHLPNGTDGHDGLTTCNGSSGGANGTHGGEPQCESAKKPSRAAAAVCFRFVAVTVGIALLVAVVTILWYYMGWTYGLPALVAATIAILVSRVGWRWFYIAAVTGPRDLKALIAYIKLLILVRKYQRKNVTVSDIFQIQVAKHPDKTCLIYEDKVWTFRDLNEFSNRIANLFHSHGYKRGDVVCLLLENRPEFIGIWLGLSKIGIITPLINTNLKGPSLLHSITVAKSSALIYGEGFTDVISETSKELPSHLALYQFNNTVNQTTEGVAKDLTTLLQSTSKDKVPSHIERAQHHDKLLYIYTSGTTGLPKAAVITHSRYIFIVAGIHYTMNFRCDDVFYTPLPLYHTAGGVMSAGQTLIFGATTVIKKKFSASGFFPDIKKYNCTVAQYIGEMCRYILATPSNPADTSHKLRLVFGNGLRPQIWPQFVERFNIPKVGEFYGATEGNANIINNDSTVGAIGFVSRIIPSIYPISIIRADLDTGEPIRNEKGLCELCQPDEPGVFIGKIIEGNPSREFLGYVDRQASEKKVVRDVFRKGDMAFLSGDLLVSDERGYLYFKDRTGDTFRWKGENVSTSEVEAQVSNVAGYRDCVVYGVEVPNLEGRAGMAAIHDPDRAIDLDEFAENIKKVLPTYARPQFIRLLTKVDLTGTFKLRKVDLQKEGFDPNKISDLLYYQTPKGKYELLTTEIYQHICDNEVRF